jgi:hypothetical protein
MHSAYVLVFLGLMVADASAQSRGACVERYRYQLGFDTSTKGTVKSGRECRTGFNYRTGKILAAELVAAPRNGTATVTQRANGRPSVIYRSRDGYVGQDTFTVALKGTTANRRNGVESEARTTRVTYNFNVVN